MLGGMMTASAAWMAAIAESFWDAMYPFHAVTRSRMACSSAAVSTGFGAAVQAAASIIIRLQAIRRIMNDPFRRK
jgi:hypothetical protein